MPTPQPDNPAANVAHQLMSEVLKLKGMRFVDGSKVTAIVNQFNIRDVEAKIYFLRELHGIIRKLPLKVFGDMQDRDRLLAAVQDALDHAIDEEDE